MSAKLCKIVNFFQNIRPNYKVSNVGPAINFNRPSPSFYLLFLIRFTLYRQHAINSVQKKVENFFIWANDFFPIKTRRPSFATQNIPELGRDRQYFLSLPCTSTAVLTRFVGGRAISQNLLSILQKKFFGHLDLADSNICSILS